MNNKERNEILLKSIDDMIEQAPEIGICPLVFKSLKIEVERLISENKQLSENNSSRVD